MNYTQHIEESLKTAKKHGVLSASFQPAKYREFYFREINKGLVKHFFSE